MHHLAPYLLFAVIALSAGWRTSPARAGEVSADETQARAVASMPLPSLARKLRARIAAAAALDAPPAEGTATPSQGEVAQGPPSLAVASPR